MAIPVVIDGFGIAPRRAAGRELDLFMHGTKIEIVAVDAERFSIARFAWRKYGKGRHPAGLNFGDCFAYALAKMSSEPLLAKGEYFQWTDLQIAVSG